MAGYTGAFVELHPLDLVRSASMVYGGDLGLMVYELADICERVFQPIGVQLNEGYYCPHPHRVIEKRAGYDKVHFVDGNVLNVSVGIAMPRPPSQADMDMIAPIESFEYCIGTSDTVVCTLLGARPRLIGIN